MLNPIAKPTGKYPQSRVPDIARLPFYAANGLIDEPYLVANSIKWQVPAEVTRLLNGAAPDMGHALEHKDLGGKITILAFCQGDEIELHKRCLDSIVKTVPLPRLDLRVAANRVSIASMAYLRTLPVTKLYVYPSFKPKYPVMRDMLYDYEQPITTNYFAWFDDTSYVNHANWLNILAQTIVAQPANVGMYGLKMYYVFDFKKEDPRDWLAQQPWHRGRPLRTKTGVPAPNGSASHFCADWFFAMRTDIARACDMPPAGLYAGGELVLGEQLYQHGYVLKNFNVGKAYIFQPAYRDLPKRENSVYSLPWHDNAQLIT